MNALDTSSASRTSVHGAEPALMQASISLAAASARRAASINVHKASHRGVTFIEHLYDFEIFFNHLGDPTRLTYAGGGAVAPENLRRGNANPEPVLSTNPSGSSCRIRRPRSIRNLSL